MFKECFSLVSNIICLSNIIKDYFYSLEEIGHHTLSKMPQNIYTTAKEIIMK